MEYFSGAKTQKMLTLQKKTFLMAAGSKHRTSGRKESSK